MVIGNQEYKHLRLFYYLDYSPSLIGIPVGIWCAQNKTVQKIVTPILDFMQTMPAFVYLIPSILFFGIGVVPGIIASFIFAIAPTIRMTNLGIQEVPERFN